MGYNMAKNTMCNPTNPKEEGQLKNGEEQLKNIMDNQENVTSGDDTCDNEKGTEKDGNEETRWILGNDWIIEWPKPRPPEQTPKMNIGNGKQNP